MAEVELTRLLVLCGIILGVSVCAQDDDARSPGCATRCGDIHVPYPFGLDPQCAIHDGFLLNCTTVDHTTKLFHGDSEVIKFSVPDGKAWLKSFISRQCYDPDTKGMLYTNAQLDVSTYVLSAEDNKVIVIGCSSLAYMLSDSYIIGCSSTCVQELKNGSCSAAAGCCQADLPKGVRYTSYFNEEYNTSKIWRTFPCNYIAVMETAAFNFSTTYLTSTVFYDTDESRKPVVMEWGIARNTCAEARVDKVTPYACVSNNSDCLTNDAGYRCKCSEGYQGNPYLIDGCKDIDECLTHRCAGICKNTPGSFTCSCPRGKSMINGLCVKNQKSVWLAPVGASVGLVVLVIVSTCAYLIRERQKLHRIKQKYFRQHGGMMLFEEMKSQQGVAFKIFSEEELQQATHMFDEHQVIGTGGHGKVYKGVLKSDVEVAVKRCMTIDDQQKKEFGKEMLILSQINHKNIVKLLGCCLEVEVPMLVYEFIPNGTLFDLMHRNHHDRHISLGTRLRIACESAEALAYLHSCASPPILHGDVKSTNILLDGDYIAKVSDFGASILAPSDKSQFVTLVQGTCGYLDPEYMQTCQLTDKSDVYSFGVVLLELLTGKKAFNIEGPEDEKSLSMMFLHAMKENKLEDILDHQIKINENMDILEEIADLAKHCLEMSGVNRPSMKEIADKLDRLRKVMLRHPWAHENTEELENLLGGSSVANSAVTTESFSVSQKISMGLESGRQSLHVIYFFCNTHIPRLCNHL